MTTAELELSADPGLALSPMREAAAQACNLMKVLANPDRLMILCQLSQGELRVGELEERLGIVQPTLSQQLTVLREQQPGCTVAAATAGVASSRAGQQQQRGRRPQAAAGRRQGGWAVRHSGSTRR